MAHVIQRLCGGCSSHYWALLFSSFKVSIRQERYFLHKWRAMSSATLLNKQINKCSSALNTMELSTASNSSSSNQKKDDSEVKAWTNQIAQDYDKGTEPFQTLEKESQDGHQVEANAVDSKSSSNTYTLTDSNSLEIEDFSYYDDSEEIEDVAPERHVPISLQRGQCGIFDVEEIVTVLETENGEDVRVIDIPPEIRFVDHMVIVSGKSLRHMRAMAATIGWLYKQKLKSGKRRSDRQFKLEGKESKNWIAIDLGNIAIHIFTPEARAHYDLETLWTLGPEHDDERHYKDDQLNLSASELFWLETSWKTANQTLPTQDSQSDSEDSQVQTSITNSTAKPHLKSDGVETSKV